MLLKATAAIRMGGGFRAVISLILFGPIVSKFGFRATHLPSLSPMTLLACTHQEGPQS